MFPLLILAIYVFYLSGAFKKEGRLCSGNSPSLLLHIAGRNFYHFHGSLPKKNSYLIAVLLFFVNNKKGRHRMLRSTVPAFLCDIRQNRLFLPYPCLQGYR